MITLKALVVRENKVGESSKAITVLSSELGIIDIFIRGGAKSSKSTSSTQLFSYSMFCLEEKKDAYGHINYYLNSCEPLSLFYNLRLDAKKQRWDAIFVNCFAFQGLKIHFAVKY